MAPKGGVGFLASAGAAHRAWNAWRGPGAVVGQAANQIRREVRYSARSRNRRGRVERARRPGRTIRVGRGRKRRRGGGRGRRRKGSGREKFLSGSKTTLPPGKYILKYKVSSLFAYNPQQTVQPD